MAASTSKSQRTSLPPSPSDEHAPTPTRLTQTSITIISLSRLFTGISCILAPRFTAGLFALPVSGQALILPRLFGARDGVLGELLWTAEREGEHNDRRELKRALWAGVAADGLDIASCAYAVATGTLSRQAGALLGGGAVVFLVLGIVGLRGV